MNVNCVQITEASQLEPLAPEQVAEALKKKAARIWLDLDDPGPHELETWLDTLGVQGLPRTLSLEARDRPGFYPLKREVVVVIPELVEGAAVHEQDHLVMLCRENLLLTFHEKPLWSPLQLGRLQESEDWLPERSIPALVSAVMLHMSIVFQRCVTELRASTLAVEERMDRDADSVEVVEILELRSDLSALEAMVNDQLPCVMGLSATNRSFFRLGDAQEIMDCALTNVRAADGSLTWLDRRLDALRFGFDMHAQDKTNRRLGILTILSAIFMPITLMAGIWGMNFEAMPELKYTLGYPGALGLMALVAVSMYAFFRRRGWFG